MVSRSCRHCGAEFHVEPAQLRHKGHGQFCSRACHYAARRAAPKAPSFTTPEGRVLLYRPDSPMANRRGYVYRYRLVMAEKLGRPLIGAEVVHHINGDCSDDRPENLELTTQSEHMRLHGAERAEERGYDLATQKWCSTCKQAKPRSEFSPTTNRGLRQLNGTCKPCAAAWQRHYRTTDAYATWNRDARPRKDAAAVHAARVAAGRIAGVASGAARRAKAATNTRETSHRID